MEYFFKPKGIALVGATTNPNKGAFSIWRNLKTGFKGPIYPINPRYTEMDGQPCYSSVRDVPDPVELAIVFVPAPMVPAVVRDCVDRGIPGVIIESAGFAETGEGGKKLQDELTAIARESRYPHLGAQLHGSGGCSRQTRIFLCFSYHLGRRPARRVMFRWWSKAACCPEGSL